MHSLDFGHVYGAPVQTAVFRHSPEDFVVVEQLSHELSGEGEHLWLSIRKRGENTEWIAKKLANHFSVRKMDIGYGGKKDRHAVTTQWFSVYLPGQDHVIDWPAFLEMAEVDAELIEAKSHSSKLKIGAHEANQFSIRLREVEVSDDLLQRLEHISIKGVPNYFGEQRFGRDGSNLERVEAWLKDTRSIRDRGLKGLIISSARSYIFNSVLSARVNDNTWSEKLEGDPELTAGPSGPMWGRGRITSDTETLLKELPILKKFESWCGALERVGLMQERRKLVLKPHDFSWSFEDGSLCISMSLGTGEYATSILRELALLEQPQRHF